MGLRLLPVNFFDQASISVSPAAVTTMPLTNLQSNIRSNVWRSTGLANQVISGSWGGNVRNVSAFAIWPGTGAAALIGSQVKLRLLANGSEVYNSGFLDFFTYTGLAWGTFLWGVGPWGVEASDKTARLAPFLIYLTATPADAFEITIAATGGIDTSYFEARRIWLAEYVEAPQTAAEGAQPQWKSGSVQQRSIGGSLRRLKRAIWRELRFDTQFESETDRQTWSDLINLCDPANEIVIDLFPTEAPARRWRDHVVMGSMEVLNPLVFQLAELHKLQVAILES